MFYIRTDANDVIASGHLMRCIAIAKALRIQGIETTFLVADEQATAILAQMNFDYRVLHTLWNCMEEEIPILRSYIAKLGIQELLIDSYQVTDHYLTEVSKNVRVTYMDDGAKKVYPVSRVINYSYTYPVEFYRTHYAGSGTRLCLGSAYVPLREEFWSIEPEPLQAQITDILVTTGGTDPYRIEEQMIEQIASKEEWRGIQFHIVVGPYVPRQQELRNLSAGHSNVTLYQNIRNMRELMMQCQIAVTAAGSTLYELCACGVPTICFAFADNQMPGMQGMAKREVVATVGDVREQTKEEFMKAVKCEISKMHAPKVRQRYRDSMRMVTDGRGAIRLAEELIHGEQEA